MSQFLHLSIYFIIKIVIQHPTIYSHVYVLNAGSDTVNKGELNLVRPRTSLHHVNYLL